MKIGWSLLRANVLLGLALFTIFGCANPASSLPSLPVRAAGAYRLGPADKLAVTVFGEQKLTGDFSISDVGSLALPLIGSVPAAGLTTDELAASIEQRLKAAGLYRNPKVAVEITEFRPIFILGEVAKPGQFPYQPGMTVLTAVAVAGGFTYRASTHAFSIVRGRVEGRAERQTQLEPGDVVTVYERVF